MGVTLGHFGICSNVFLDQDDSLLESSLSGTFRDVWLWQRFHLEDSKILFSQDFTNISHMLSAQSGT